MAAASNIRTYYSDCKFFFYFTMFRFIGGTGLGKRNKKKHKFEIYFTAWMNDTVLSELLIGLPIYHKLLGEINFQNIVSLIL